MEPVMDSMLLALAGRIAKALASSGGVSLREAQTPQERDENKILRALTDPAIFGDDIGRLRNMVGRSAWDLLTAAKLWATDSSQDGERTRWLREATQIFRKMLKDILDDNNPVKRAEMEDMARWLSWTRVPGIEITASPWVKYGKARCYVNARGDDGDCTFICEMDGRVRFQNSCREEDRPAWVNDVFDALKDVLRRRAGDRDFLQRAAEERRIGHYGERGIKFMDLAKRIIADPYFLSSDDRLACALSNMSSRDKKSRAASVQEFGHISDLGCKLLDASRRWNDANYKAEKKWKQALSSFAQAVNAAVRDDVKSAEHEKMRTLAQRIERDCSSYNTVVSVFPQVDYETSRCLVIAEWGQHETFEDEGTVDSEESERSERFVAYDRYTYYVTENDVQYAKPIRGTWDPVRYKPEPWVGVVLMTCGGHRNTMRNDLARTAKKMLHGPNDVRSPGPVEPNLPETEDPVYYSR